MLSSCDKFIVYDNHDKKTKKTTINNKKIKHNFIINKNIFRVLGELLRYS